MNLKKTYYLYILASKKYGTLYIGITNDLCRRLWQHKHKIVPSFTARYNINTLVYFESSYSIDFIIRREKRMKKWKRQWKIDLIEINNPNWTDLYPSLCGTI